MQNDGLPRYTIFDLCLALPLGAASISVRLLRGRVSFTEAECVEQVRRFFLGALPGALTICFLYGLICSYIAATRLPTPAAYLSFIMPQMGGAFTEYLIPFAIAQLVGVKGVVATVSDIAAMRLSREVSALAVLGLDPATAIFVPRALALVVAAPILAVVGIYAGALGAWIGARVLLDVSLLAFWSDFVQSITARKLIATILKVSIVAFTLSVIAGYRAFQPSRRAGQLYVGALATAASASAALAITVVNLLFHLLEPLWR